MNEENPNPKQRSIENKKEGRNRKRYKDLVT